MIKPKQIKVVHFEDVKASAMQKPPTYAETAGLKSFFSRYWGFLVACAVFLALVLDNWVFKYLGALTYLPLLSFGVFILAFVMRYILNKRTTDAYIETDAYEKDFAALPTIHKCWIVQVQFLVYILVIAILASKVLGR